MSCSICRKKLKLEVIDLGNAPITNNLLKKIAKKKTTKTYPLKHKDHKLTIVNGKWGPHTKRVVCLSCNGAFVMWGKKSK